MGFTGTVSFHRPVGAAPKCGTRAHDRLLVGLPCDSPIFGDCPLLGRPGVSIMTAVDPSAGGADSCEQLIGALIPPDTRCCSPVPPMIVASLPALALPADVDPASLLLEVVRLDASGRLSARGLMRALGWSPGVRVDITVVDDAVLIGCSPQGSHIVGSRGELAIAAAARGLAGIDGGTVLLVASPGQGILVVHCVAVVARLLADHYGRQAGER